MFASLARGIGFLTMIVLVGGLVAFGLGFFWFIMQVPSEEIRLADKADGIVVLTGAASRRGRHLGECPVRQCQHS